MKQTGNPENVIPMELEEIIKTFVAQSEQEGKLADLEKLKNLNMKLHGIIPEWYIKVISTIPICDILLNWQKFEYSDEFDGIEEIQILDESLLEEINCESYPGIYLTPSKYFVFGYGASWAGNCFAFPITESNDPPVYEVWHDVAQNSDEILKAIIMKNNSLKAKAVNKQNYSSK